MRGLSPVVLEKIRSLAKLRIKEKKGENGLNLKITMGV
jgi:hypothetical protein